MTRQQLMDKGKLYQVYTADDPDSILFEGSKTACNEWVRQMFGTRELKSGRIRIGKLIWEA